MERSAEEWLAEGNAHYDAQRWAAAGTALERSLAIDPMQADAWYRLGNVREEEGRDGAAAACFEKSVALDPAHARAWNNLGGARQRLGMEAPAIEAYRRAIGADPCLAQPSLNLGRLYSVRGDHAAAAACFKAALGHRPGDATFEHLLAAALGTNTERAPRDYVTTLFDTVAAQFEQHLVRDLDYRVPEALAEFARATLQAVRPAHSALAIDLGCGTGLIGAALADTGARIAGVDLSPRMLQIAAERGVYANLAQEDIVDFLRKTASASVHAVLAADVFIYIGDLEAVFSAAARALAPGGVFAFSVEGLAEGTYRLQASGRYAQSPAYLRALAAGSGLEERRLERGRIRREGSGYAEGWLALFVKESIKA